MKIILLGEQWRNRTPFIKTQHFQNGSITFYQDKKRIVMPAASFHQLSNLSQASTMCLISYKQTFNDVEDKRGRMRT